MLESLGRFIAPKVGLVNEALNRLAANPEPAAFATYLKSAECEWLNAVHDNASRLRRMGERLRIGEEFGKRFAKFCDPFPFCSTQRRAGNNMEAELPEGRRYRLTDVHGELVPGLVG